jgi:isopentenyldiphosphate isomerase
MFFVFLLHTFLIVWSAWYWSEEAWAFISGGLFYILFGLLFIGQLIYSRLFKRKMIAKEEWFDIVDQNGRVLGKAPRSYIHGNPKLIHPTVHIHVFNKKGLLYLQKRVQTKDLYPGRWDTAVGGHVSSGESIQHALLREAKEELGIDASSAQPLFKYVMTNKWESELIHTYKIVKEGPFNLSPEEIEEGRFWTAFEIEKNIGNSIFTPNFEQEFKMLKQLKLI